MFATSIRLYQPNDESEMSQILAPISRLYAMSKKNWPELEDFCLSNSDENLLLLGQIYATLTFIRSEKFVSAHATQSFQSSND
jgi:hypothetical protein